MHYNPCLPRMAGHGTGRGKPDGECGGFIRDPNAFPAHFTAKQESARAALQSLILSEPRRMSPSHAGPSSSSLPSVGAKKVPGRGARLHGAMESRPGESTRSHFAPHMHASPGRRRADYVPYGRIGHKPHGAQQVALGGGSHAGEMRRARANTATAAPDDDMLQQLASAATRVAPVDRRKLYALDLPERRSYGAHTGAMLDPRSTPSRRWTDSATVHREFVPPQSRNVLETDTPNLVLYDEPDELDSNDLQQTSKDSAPIAATADSSESDSAFLATQSRRQEILNRLQSKVSQRIEAKRARPKDGDNS